METRKDQGQLLWGILLVVLGLLFLSANFGYGTWFNWDRWWPVVLIVIGLGILYRRNERVEPGTASVSQTPTGPAEPALPAAGQPAVADQAAASRRRYPTGAFILIGLGVAFLLEDVVGGNAVPAFILIAIGLALVLRSRVTP